MELKDIKKIIELMKANDLSEFELEEEGFRIALKRRNGWDAPLVTATAGVEGGAAAGREAGASAAHEVGAAAPGATPEEEEAGERILSPMVGTFYRSTSPDASPFVNVGDEVDEDAVVCIIEAMKVMNEIKAETRGVVKKVLVENGTPVEYGQPLFLIEPR